MNGFKKVAYFYKNYFNVFRKLVKAKLNLVDMQAYLNNLFHNNFLYPSTNFSKTKLVKFKLLTTTVKFNNKDFITVFEQKNETQLVAENWQIHNAYIYDVVTLKHLSVCSLNKSQSDLILKKIFLFIK